MIDQSKTYRTRAGREVRIYAVDGEPDYPVQGAMKLDRGWVVNCWTADGADRSATVSAGAWDLIESDPHGILPRHRELLAEQMSHLMPRGDVENVLTRDFGSLSWTAQAALIALARLEKEKS